jgi:uncharacterized protein (TIGR03437 family)
MVQDTNRQRLYIANSALNRVEIFDTRQRRFLSPIKVGQLPRLLALSPDGNTLYVANTGGEAISIVDLDQRQVVDRVKFPPIPFNANVALVTPAAMAASLRGPMIVMTNGTLWSVVNGEAVPRGVSAVIGKDTAGRPTPIPGPQRTMVSTPGGEYILLLSANGFVYLYDAMTDDFVQSRQLFTGRPQGYYGPVAAGPLGQYFLANGTLLNQSLTPIAAGQPPAGRPIYAVAPAGAASFIRFVQPARASASVLPAEFPVVELVNVSTGAVTRSQAALEGPLSTVVASTAAAVFVGARTMAFDAAGPTAYLLTTSGVSVVPLDGAVVADRPAVNNGGVVNLADYTAAMAPGSLVSIFGRNLGSPAVAGSTPLPGILDGACVTLNNQPIPLLMTSPGQINAQIPPELAAGRYTMVVRSIDKKSSAPAQQVTIAKVAPAVFVDPVSRRAAVFHSDGRWVTKEDPAQRDEVLLLYALGLGATKGGQAKAGQASPASPLAVVPDVDVFFGDPRYKEAGIIVEWAGLAPGFVGLYQINLRVPGAHISGQALPITLRVGTVDSSLKGPLVPTVPVD